MVAVMKADIKVSFCLAIPLVALAVFPVLQSVAAEAAYYMYRNDDGVLTFSQTAPRGVDYEAVTKPERPFGFPRPPRAAAVPEPSESTGPQPLPESREPSEARSGEITAADIERDNDATVRRNCLKARQTLAQLLEYKQIIVQSDDGVWREISDDQREQELDEIRADITEWCETRLGGS